MAANLNRLFRGVRWVGEQKIADSSPSANWCRWPHRARLPLGRAAARFSLPFAASHALDDSTQDAGLRRRRAAFARPYTMRALFAPRLSEAMFDTDGSRSRAKLCQPPNCAAAHGNGRHVAIAKGRRKDLLPTRVSCPAQPIFARGATA